MAARLPENPWATLWRARLIGSEDRPNLREISAQRSAAANVSAACPPELNVAAMAR
jgi:hypothetical protein